MKTSQYAIANLIKYTFSLCIFFLIAIVFLNFSYVPQAIAQETNYRNYYRTKTFHNPDGIGKYYMEREIAQVMGHQAMMWLERDGREREEKPQAVVEHLDLKSTDSVADLGTGTGYFAFRIAELIPEGKVYAVDIQPEMLDVVNLLKEKNKISNIETVLGTENNPQLPANSIDLALMVDAYHEFAYPREMMENLYSALKPQGRVILVEYRQENPMIMIKPLHKMSQKQVKKEMKAVNLKWLKTQEFLPEQHFMIFQKPGK
ncbi:class I SAM-dependent methyltransferase [Hyella patelloides]|nr:class I SAM-dependent methyltransferase [Hyella patelloides]